MSSTNRGYERHKTDYYVTPEKNIHQFFDKFDEFYDLNDEVEFTEALDPCAGGDAKHGMSYPNVLNQRYPNLTVRTMDVREDSLAEFPDTDFLSWDKNQKPFDDLEPSIIISNPPFYLAEQFVRKSYEVAPDGCLIVFLLRLNFLGSNARFPLFQELPPSAIFTHHRRMSFTDDGKTDSIEYAHFLWIKDEHNPHKQPINLFVI